MTKLTLSRRAALLGAAGLPAAALLGRAAPAAAEAPMMGVARPSHYRFKVGSFEVTTILDGAIQRENPHGIFGIDRPRNELEALLAQNFLPTGALENGYTPVVVNTGRQVILFDSGNGARRRPERGNLTALLAETGIPAEAVDVVVLTHFHGDHIGGLMEDGAPSFPNARYVTSAVEFDFWRQPDSPNQRIAGGSKLAAEMVAPLAPKTTFIKPGEDVVTGVTAVDAAGHSPGHMAYHIESDGRRLMILADACNHYVASLQRPDWHVVFDMDKEAAAATRKRLLGMIAADRVPFAGYHMPFPAVGYVEQTGSSFRYVPVGYQLNL
ncbi:MAG: MBL fold metallo-hydrolase [Pseudomonadota bacterium]